MKKRLSKIAAVSMAASIAASMAIPGITASAADNNIMPKQLYMTDYKSNSNLRRQRVETQVNAAKGVLSQLDTSVALAGVAAPNLDAVVLTVGSTHYDHLIGSTVCTDGTILTFNSESALKAGMSKIKTEEQNLIDNAFKPYVNYIDSVIASGAFTTKVESDSEADIAKKQVNLSLLQTAKSTLSYTYADTDLFYGDVTGGAKTYQIAYLSESVVGSNYESRQTVIANNEEFRNFPVITGMDWQTVHHLDIQGNSNNSWWYAKGDGATLNNDLYWLNGMMIPNFLSSIAYDAYANNSWFQYGSIADNTNPDKPTDPTDPTVDADDYYYNASYNKVSDNVYTISNGTYTFYYPNLDYAKAALKAKPGFSITDIVKSDHSSSKTFFCFKTGKYYTSPKDSAYPEATIYMSGAGSDNSDVTYTYYTIKNGCVYDKDGKLIDTVYNRGYSSYATWFCTENGWFYTNPQAGKTGYYVTASMIGDNTTNNGYSIKNGYVYDKNGRPVDTVYNRGYSSYATWFCIETGWFYNAPQTGKTGYYVTASMIGDNTTNNGYSIKNGYVYDKLGNKVDTVYNRGYSPYATWFCTDDGRFYTAAQPGKNGYTVTNAMITGSNSIDPTDPYYWYWYMKFMETQNNNNNNNKPSNNNNSSSSSSNSNNQTSSTKDNITTIYMNNNPVLSGSKLAGARASKNALRLIMKNKAEWFIQGTDVIKAQDVNFSVTYNTNNIPAPLRKAIREGCTATSSMTFGENVDWGTTATVRVKFKADRANYIAKLYRYDTATNQLIFVSQTTIGAEGYASFSGINHGGDYIVTLS